MTPRVPVRRSRGVGAGGLGDVLDEVDVRAGDLGEGVGVGARPKRCTARMARVRGVMRSATSAGSRLKVARSMSAKTGVAPTRWMALAVAK
jgi:hypothetical protein